MAIPKFKKEYIIEALKYIDKNGVPFHNQSTKYELVTDDGKRYPPKYVVGVADHLANPDFISRNSEMRTIADAKYKPIDNIGNRDYLQVLAYMFRFDAKTGYYLYPEAGGFDDLKLRMNRGSTYEANVSPRNDITIIKHGLKIPVDAPDYSSFVTRMEVYEHEFRCVFSTNTVYAVTKNLIN